MNISSSVVIMMIAISDQAQDNLRKAMFRIAFEIIFWSQFKLEIRNPWTKTDWSRFWTPEPTKFEYLAGIRAQNITSK